MKRNNERMAFAITFFLSITVIISVFGASSNKLVLSASSNTTEQSSEAVETAASADTTSQAPTEFSQTTGQDHSGDTSNQDSIVPSNHPDLIRHVNAGEYEKAFEYINQLKYGGMKTATKTNPWFSKDNIAILISVLAVMISLWHHFIDGVRNKKKDTLDAYNTLQQDAFDVLNGIRKLYPKLYDDRSIKERTKIMGCLARIERFSVGIDSGVFDIGVLKKCGGAYFVRMYYYLEDIINGKQEPDRDRGGEHYNAFRKVKNQLEEEYEKEGTPITPFGLIKTKNLTLRHWEINDVDLLPDYAKGLKVQIDGFAKGQTVEERQRIIMSYFRGKEAYIITTNTKKNDQNDKKTIGTIELNTEVKYIFGKQVIIYKVYCWFKDENSKVSYMSEAVKAMYRHAYKDRGVGTVYTGPFKDKKEVDSFIKKGDFSPMQDQEEKEKSDIYIYVIPKEAENRRTVVQLLNIKPENQPRHLYVYCKSKAIAKQFLSDAERERFTFGDGKQPTIKHTSKLFELNDKSTIRYTGIKAHMKLGCQMEGVYWVDYEKYVSGERDFQVKKEN